MSEGRHWPGTLRALGIVLTLGLGAPLVRPGELEELGSVERFRDRFNRDHGKPRLILLLSPT